jgi:hypothetical protein
MSSILELRNKLANRKSRKQPVVSHRTCLEIILKLNRDGFFGSEGLIFTTDGQEVMTSSVLDSEIIHELNGRRKLLSELSRSLTVSEETIQARCKVIPSITLYLGDAIASCWFVSQARTVESLVDQAGELHFNQLAEKLNIPLDIFSGRVLGDVSQAQVERTSNSLVSRRFMEIINRRVRGVVNALTAPRDVKWIAAQVGCPASTDICTVIERVTGTNPKDDVFMPKIWIDKQIESGQKMWKEFSWVPLSSIRLECGSARQDLANWLAQNALKENVDCVILSQCILRVDKHLTSSVREIILEHDWFDMYSVIGAKLRAPIEDSDYPAIGHALKGALIELSGQRWKISGSVMYSTEIARSVLEGLNVSSISAQLQKRFGIDESTFSPYDELISLIESLISQAKSDLTPLERLEESISDRTNEILSDVRITGLGELVKSTSLVDLVNQVFVYAAMRFAGATKPTAKSLEDRENIIKSLPTVEGKVNPFHDALVRLNDLLSGSQAIASTLRSILNELTISVSTPRKVSKRTILNELCDDLDYARKSDDVLKYALRVLIAHSTGIKPSIMSDELISSPDVPSQFTARLEELKNLRMYHEWIPEFKASIRVFVSS